MARKTMNLEDKKIKFSITINPDINKQLNDLHINKSKLINWLLQEYFNQIILK
jgi:hypothetical protein